MTARKPTAIKLLEGTYRRDRANPDEPRVPPLTAIPAPPRFMPLTGLARRAWRDLARRSIDFGILTDADLPALASVCRDFEEWQTAQADGTSWRRGDAAKRRYDAGLRAFGLTPADRSRVHTTPPAQRDPLAEWMASGPSTTPPPPPPATRRRPATPTSPPAAGRFAAWQAGDTTERTKPA